MHALQVLFQPSSLTFLALGFGVTLEIAAATIALSFVGGIVLAVIRYSGDIHPDHRAAVAASRAALWWIEAIRNLPMLLLMLAMRFWSGLPPIWAAIAGMTLFTSAVMAEIVRGGLVSVDRGQWEAAFSQGMTSPQILWHIVLPQALRRMIPPIVSEFVTIIKDTSYAWGLGVIELTGSGAILLAKQPAAAMQLFAVIAAVYFVTNLALRAYSRRLERRYAAAAY
ncbi:MAG: amino acid ABC transporter permease [Clostridia bacterium]|nr:amino acid ABC transporter permease [Clostridia bacterium]